MSEFLDTQDHCPDKEAEEKEGQLNQIKADIIKNLECPLKDQANNLVFGKGNPNTNLVFIGEAPGKNEDLQGYPFVGSAGKKLDALLNNINLELKDIYIANILKYRPPNNRDPTKEDIRRHTPYLIQQLKVIQPKIIATLGNFSTRFVLSKFNTDEMSKIPGISKIHGVEKNIQVNDFNFKVIPLYHPAAMIYNPKLKETLEEDFKKIQSILNQ